MSGCSTQDIPPQFALTDDFDTVPNNTAFQKLLPEEKIPLEAYHSPVAIALASNLRTQFPSHSEIFDLFDNAGNLVSRLKVRLLDSKRDIPKNTVWSWQNIHPLQHRVLSCCVPLDFDDLGSIIQEAIRIGMLLFFTQIRRNFAIAPKVYVDIYIERRKFMVLIFGGSIRRFGWRMLEDI